MQIEVFETQQSNAEGVEGMKKLKTLLAEDGRTISVEKIYTAGGGNEHYSRHWVTVLFFTLENPPADLALEATIAEARRAVRRTSY